MCQALSEKGKLKHEKILIRALRLQGRPPQPGLGDGSVLHGSSREAQRLP